MMADNRQAELQEKLTAPSMSPAGKRLSRLIAGSTMIGTGLGLMVTGVGASAGIPLALSGLWMMRNPGAGGYSGAGY